jgi:hypothetical protein
LNAGHYCHCSFTLCSPSLMSYSCLSHLVNQVGSEELCLAQGHARLGASAGFKQRAIEFLICAQPLGPQ